MLCMVEKEKPAMGPRLRSLREKAGMTQMQLAMNAGVSLSLVAQIEQGARPDPRLSTLLSLAKALGIPACQLIDEAEAANTKSPAKPKKGRAAKGK
jgi:transcriptional regulator with XRE-family HTH domain